MNSPSLSLSQTPPLSVPIRYMVTAPLFAMAAAVIIFLNPEMLFNRWSADSLAAAHMLILGFVVMVMFGALQQLLPVLAGVRFNHPVLISAGLHIGLTIGTLALCLGFYLMNSLAFIVAMVVLASTIIGLVTLALYSLLASESSFSVVWGLRLPMLAFLATALIGLYLTGGYAFDGISIARNLTSLHYIWGFMGWVGLLIITISYQVVPMFQITPKYPPFMIRWLVPGLFALLLLWTLLQFGGQFGGQYTQYLESLLSLALFVGYGLYIFQTLKLQQLRKRSLPDVTLDFWRVGLVCMLLAAGLWCAGTFLTSLDSLNGWVTMPLLGAVLLIPGAVMSLINGMLYKIIPFLVWLHLTNQVDMSSRWQKSIPNMKKIIGETHSRNQFKLHCLAVLILAGATVRFPLQSEVLRVGAVMLFLSNLYLFRNIVTALKTYQSVLLETD